MYEVWQIREDGSRIEKVGQAQDDQNAALIMCTAFSLWGLTVVVYDGDEVIAAIGRG